MKKAIALYRVSTYRQSVEGHSLDAQEERVIKAAAFWEATIVRHWRVDASSKVGKNLARKDLREALAHCKQHKTDYFIIDEVDRFMRSIDEYYWYKVEFKKVGTKLMFASQPELSEEGQFAKLRELLAVYEGEASNAERSRKTIDKMKARIAQGYYLSHPHAGYMKSDIPGLHIPDPTRFDLLRKGGQLIIYEQYTVSQAVRWMNDNGYRTIGGQKLDVSHYIEFTVDRYYCGKIDIQSRGWPKDIDGRHTAMFSEREHKLLALVFKKRNPRLRRKHNPDFPLANILRHQECSGKGGCEKFAGHNFNRGRRKSGTQRKLLPVYDCRGCRQRIRREKVHLAFSEYLSTLSLVPDEKTFREALVKVWGKQRGSHTQRIATLNAKKENIELKISQTAAAFAAEPEGPVKQSLRKLLLGYDVELGQVEDEIASTESIEIESENFVSFAMNFTANIKENWWATSYDNRKRGEQVLFNGEIYADNSVKVHTPNLSTIYRLGINKKALSKLDNAHLVELPGTTPGSDGLIVSLLQA